MILLLSAFGLAFWWRFKLGDWVRTRWRLPTPDDLQVERDVPGHERTPLAKRALAKVFGCIYCAGFHAGWIVWLLEVRAPILVWAFAAAGFAFLVDTAARFFERA